MAGEPTFKRGFEFPSSARGAFGQRRDSSDLPTGQVAADRWYDPAPMKSTLLTSLPLALLAACHSQPTYLPNGDLAPATDADNQKGGIYDVSFKSIKDNPTPELFGVNERTVDIDRNMAVNTNQTTRMFWSDLGRLWLTDEPSPLSPYPTVNTTGNP
jgi:hypothetical protein